MSQAAGYSASERVRELVYVAPSVSVQVFAEKMGLETGWNCHISLTPNGDSPCDGAPSSPSQGSLHEDLNQGTRRVCKNFILFHLQQGCTT